MEQPGEQEQAAAAFAPVARRERVVSVDVLRGVALLGILAMNIYAFAMPFSAYTNPLLWGGTGKLDMGTWWFTHLLFEMKFMTIFSALFGAGLALMAERAAARGAKIGRLYYRRLMWLLLIGAVHGYLLWFGDILFSYAVCGMILFPLRRLRPRTLIAIGFLMMLVLVPLGLGFGHFVLPKMQQEAEDAVAARDAGETLTEEQEQAIEGWDAMVPPPAKVEEELAAYRGGYVQQVVFRAPLVLQLQTGMLIFFGLWRIGGLMLIGVALMKLGVFSASRSKRFYTLCCVIGYGVGLPLVYFGARRLVEHEFDPLFVNQVGLFPNYFGSLFVALAHVGVVMLVCQSGVLASWTRRLAAVGRMALTHYLTHSLICTTIFYGWGLGLFGHVDRFALMGIVVGIWLFQLAVSPGWLARFRFGPAEWLWRSLTYRKRQPMRTEGAA